MNNSILQKYNVPGPRYTSYPTVPYWQTEPILENVWKDRLMDSILKKDSFWNKIKKYIYILVLLLIFLIILIIICLILLFNLTCSKA